MARTDLDAVFGGAEPLENPANEPMFRALVGLGADLGPSSAWATATSAQPPPCLPRAVRTGPAAWSSAAWPANWPAPDSAQRLSPQACSSRAAPTTSRTAMHPPISWSALADASVGVWGLGVEGQASVRRLRAMGCRARPGRRRTRRARPRRARSPGDGVGGPRRAPPLRRRGQEPRHQPLPPRRGTARGGGGRRVRWPRPLRGGGRSGPCGLHHRDQGQEHDDRAGRAPPHAGSAIAPGPAGTSATLPGTPPPSPSPTTGSSRRRASRCPTSPSRPASSP